MREQAGKSGVPEVATQDQDVLASRLRCAHMALFLQAGERLIAEAAHDLRSPLNGIQGWAHVIESRLGQAASPILNKALEGIKIGVQQQVGLIADLVDMRSILNEAFELNPQPLHVDQLLDEACERMAVLAQARRVVVVARMHVGAPILTADRAQLVRALEAILAYCIRSALEGDEIVLQSVTREDAVYWFVGEDGSAPTQAGLGEGRLRVPAGLRLADALVRLHGGQIEHVIPSVEGAMPAFRVRVPLVPAPLAQARRTAAARLAMPAQLPRVALIANSPPPVALPNALRALGIEPQVLTLPLPGDAAERFDVLCAPVSLGARLAWHGPWLAWADHAVVVSEPGLRQVTAMVPHEVEPAWLADCLYAILSAPTR